LAAFVLLLLPGRKAPKTPWMTAVWLSLAFSIGWLFMACRWTYVAMHTYGGLGALPAGLAAFTLAAFLSVYYVIACALFVRWIDLNSPLMPISFCAVWLMAELARGTFFTGFGWGAIGYAHVEGPLAGFGPWVGVYGIGAIAAWSAATLAAMVAAPGRRGRLVFFACLCAVMGLGYSLQKFGAMTQSTGSLEFKLLQGNIPQDEKFEPGKGIPIALEWYGEQLRASHDVLFIAPETAIPLLPEQLHPDFWAALVQQFQSGERAALIGMPMGNFREGYTNSVVGLQPGQTPWRYDKQHLVPFGEFIPGWFRWFTAMMHIPLGDFTRGKPLQPPFIWRGQSLSANICYENLFSEQLAEHFIEPKSAPHILVNISNLAWFGGTVALDQHLQIARMRAIEFGRPYLLATNTGPTAILDHQGNIVKALPHDVRGVLAGKVDGRSGITHYAGWISRWGLWPYWLFALLIVGMAVWRRLTKR
jgi:apolipoprotein N-acyltransferase